jgi:hypothetical protein
VTSLDITCIRNFEKAEGLVQEFKWRDILTRYGHGLSLISASKEYLQLLVAVSVKYLFFALSEELPHF